MNRVNRSAAQSKKIVFPWEKELNPEQRSAVESIEGPLMILAGAGSGKTRVIAYRIAYLVASRTINADKILALTFTNKAAKEMRARVLQLINTNNNKLWFGTFHSIFARILRQEAGKIGFKKNYSIYDESNQIRAIKDVILKRNLPTGEYTPQELLKSISKLKSRLISPADYKISETNSIKQKVLSPVYGAYNDYLRSNNAMDFDDLLFYTYRLFKNNPDTLRLYQNRFRYMLVDEFQDTNIAQYQIIIQLVSKHNNICVVGDDDQSIYRWRGAEIKNILQFEHDFPNTKIVRLEQNYRSTENILKAANSVIKNNKIRHEKALWTDKGTGEQITLYIANYDFDEAQWITKSITASVSRDKWNWGDFAILYRLNAQSRLLEDSLRREQIPYTVIGGLRFYDRKEVKDVLAYLCLVVNPDDDVSLKRIINYPHRGLGKKTIENLENYASEQGMQLFKALSQGGKVPGISAKRANAVVSFYQLIYKYRKLRNKVSILELVSSLIEEAGISHSLQLESEHDSLNRVENVNELLRAIEEYASQFPDATIDNYLADVVLISDIDSWDDEHQHVSLMTFHSAKGLEFPVVHLTGLEDGILPIQSSLDDPEAIEEERRLFYVGATRAKEVLNLSSSRSRVMFGEELKYQPSRFLSEIDKDTVYMPEVKKTFTLRKPVRSGSGPVLVKASQLQNNSKFKIGVRVAHEDFGLGVVQNVEGEMNAAKIKVLFEGNVLKNLMVQYASLKIIGE